MAGSRSANRPTASESGRLGDKHQLLQEQDKQAARCSQAKDLHDLLYLQPRDKSATCMRAPVTSKASANEHRETDVPKPRWKDDQLNTERTESRREQLGMGRKSGEQQP